MKAVSTRVHYLVFSQKKPIKNILFGLLCILTSACTNTSLYVANKLALYGNYQLEADVQYGNVKKQKLDIYSPTINPKHVTVIFFYGGCWGACSQLNKENYRFVAQTLTAHGMHVVIPDFRKYPDVLFPDIMQDAAHSVAWVRENIEKYGGSSDNIYLMGHSSGAHIASMLNYNENYLAPTVLDKIKGFIGLAGPYDFLPFTEAYQPGLFAPVESYAQSQTINYVDGSEPPALLLYGNSDLRVQRRNIESLTKIIEAKQGLVQTHFYNDIDHVDIIGDFSMPLRSSSLVVADVLNFILTRKI